MMGVSPYQRFPRIPRWRRELRITLPALVLVAFALIAVWQVFQL